MEGSLGRARARGYELTGRIDTALIRRGTAAMDGEMSPAAQRKLTTKLRTRELAFLEATSWHLPLTPERSVFPALDTVIPAS